MATATKQARQGDQRQSDQKQSDQKQSDQKQTGQRQTGQRQQARSGNFPLDNLSYDMVTLLYEKSKALEAFDKYQQDARNDQEVMQLFDQMRQSDEQFIEQLRQQLGQRLSQQ